MKQVKKSPPVLRRIDIQELHVFHGPGNIIRRELIHVCYTNGHHELRSGNRSSGVVGYDAVARLDEWAAVTPYYDKLLPEVFLLESAIHVRKMTSQEAKERGLR